MRAGADGRPELAVARQSSPELAVLAEFALPLPSFFLTSIAGAFGFEGGSAGCLGGCLPATVAPESADAALTALRAVPGCERAADIGEVKTEPPAMVLVDTAFGGRWVMDQLVGDTLPRIC